MNNRLCITHLLLIVLLSFVFFAKASVAVAAESATNLTPRWLPAKPTTTKVRPWQSHDTIELKFRDGTSYELRDNAITSLRAQDDVARLKEVFRRHPVEQRAPLFSRLESTFDQTRSLLEKKTDKQLPDLRLWFRLKVAPGTDIEKLIDALNALPDVEIAYPAPLPVPPPSTPSFVSQQGYLGPASSGGIDAGYAWPIGGGTGDQVAIVDVEYAFNPDHEDLPSIPVLSGEMWDGSGSNTDHGTAVLGELFAPANEFSVTGIAYGATGKFVSLCSSASDCGDYNLANAINIASSAIEAGDVILVEQQSPACGSTANGPSEWIPSVFDAIKAGP